MPFCIKCGVANNSLSRFCLKCGTPLHSTANFLNDVKSNSPIATPPPLEAKADDKKAGSLNDDVFTNHTETPPFLTENTSPSSNQANTEEQPVIPATLNNLSNEINKVTDNKLEEEKRIRYQEFEEQERNSILKTKRRVFIGLSLGILLIVVIWYFTRSTDELASSEKPKNKINIDSTGTNTRIKASNFSLEELNKTKWFADKLKMENTGQGLIEFEQKTASFAVLDNQLYLAFNLENSNDTILLFYDNEKSDWGAGFARGDLAFPNSPEPKSLFAKAVIKENELQVSYINKVFVDAVNNYFPGSPLPFPSVFYKSESTSRVALEGTNPSTQYTFNFILDSLKRFKSHAQLVHFFGNANVVKESGNSTEGELYYSILYPNTKNYVTFYWEKNFKNLKYLQIDHPDSDWSTKDGISLKMTIDDIVKINGADVSFWGFEIDNDAAGTVFNYNNGSLSKKNILISFGVGKGTDDNTYSEFIQNQPQELSSNMASIKPLNLQVDFLRVW